FCQNRLGRPLDRGTGAPTGECQGFFGCSRMSAGEPKGDFVRRSSFDFAPDPARSRRVGPGRYSGPTRFSKFVTKGSGSVQAVRKLRRRLRPYPTRPIVPITATRRLEGSGTVGVTCPIDDGG